ncbi:MAG TPA: multicopper oxidase domain-containing protein, partial [Actinomycetota bacterium]
TNNLDHEGTGIHWHGIELANPMDGTPLTQNLVPPGGSRDYEFTVTRPGVYWYHPHHHSSTNQVFKGMYGSIIVTDPDDTALRGSVLPSSAQTRTLVLGDITVCKAPGSNDTVTYDPSLPWLDGTAGPLPAQGGPKPDDLCDTPIDDHGNPLGAALPAGGVPNIQKSGSSGQVNEGQTVLTNGENVGARAGSPSAPGALAAGAQTMDVAPGQGVRLQVIDVATTRFFRLRLTDASGAQIPLVRVGGQGGLLDSAEVPGGVEASGFDWKYGAGELLLDPGDRQDVVFAVPASASGVLTLWTMDFSRTGAGFAKLPSVPVAHFNVTGPAVSPAYTIADGTPLLASLGSANEVLGPADGALIDPSTLSPAELGTADPDIQLTNIETGGTTLGINGVQGIHDFVGDFTTFPHSGSSRWADIGDTLELTVTNRTSGHHPFHLHGFSIQPIELTRTGQPSYTYPQAEFRDNIDIPAHYTLRFRVRLEDRPHPDGTPGGALGRWVIHCHIFFHAVFGMITELVVTGTPVTNEPPTIAADAASVAVDEGAVAAMTGTYEDPDGDTLAFTASVGAVTDNGDGTWSWSYPTTDGPTDSQSVTVTTTDPDGESADATFALDVANVAPSVAIASPADGTLFQLADAVPVSAPFTDPGTGDTHTCSIDWGDGTSSAGTVAAGACTGSHTYAAGGLKTITVTVLDDDGGSGSDSVEIDVNTPPDCTPVQPSPATLWSPNGKLVPVTLAGATDADGDVVTLTVTGVTQDEPVNGKGDGNTAPDAALVPAHSERVELRAERSGKGDGRVYTIGFGGDDGRGGTCTATKTVSVPHGQSGAAAVDSGFTFGSL